jgi:hypothetical protein
VKQKLLLSSCLAPALGVTKFIIPTDVTFGHTLLCYLSQPELGLLNGLEQRNSVTKIVPLAIVNLVTPKAGAKHWSHFDVLLKSDLNVQQNVLNVLWPVYETKAHSQLKVLV